jgi:hypothetical protein
MRTRFLRSTLLLTLLGALPLSSSLAADDAPPQASQVIVRGRTKLVDALEVAIGVVPKAERGPTISSTRGLAVLLVLDVTPYTAARGRDLGEALAALDERYPGPGRWSFARLGEKPTKAFALPSALGPILRASLSRDTSVVATIPAVAAPLKADSSEGARIVYLADWHFEDDVGLEKLVQTLQRDGAKLSVVGSEAGFGRAWIDGFYPPDRGKTLSRGVRKLYAEGVGRSPFGPEDAEAPWHGGDTAWPHYPFHTGCTPWSTKFPVELPPVPVRGKSAKKDRYAKPGEKGEEGKKGKAGNPEDLQARLKEKHAPEALERYWFPLPSSFGSYPLMRLAGVSGGKYVLFSWNPAGRSDVSYSYSRCNLFGPDLRPRKAIHADVRTRPLARAILKAWHQVANEDAHVVDVTPPLESDARKPLAMQETSGPILPFHWDTRREYEQFMARAPVHHAAIGRGIETLRAGLAEPRKDDVDTRYEADLMLFLHTLEVRYFQLGEALAAARTLKVKTAWDRLPLHPGLDPDWFVAPQDKLDIPTGVDLRNEKAGAEVRAARQAFRKRFAGTPFGELVHRNGLTTYKLRWIGYATGQPTKESPGESAGGKPPSTPPPSGGKGPSTGR